MTQQRTFPENVSHATIPEAAIEAGAKALWDMDREATQKTFEDCREGAKRHLRREARTILEAAAPLIPRTITTREELDALPSGSVILGSDGEPNVLHDNGWVLPGGDGGYTSWAVAQYLPATVLHEPAVQ